MNLRLRSTALWAVGIVKTVHVTDIYLKQVAVKQHMKGIYYSETKKSLYLTLRSTVPKAVSIVNLFF